MSYELSIFVFDFTGSFLIIIKCININVKNIIGLGSRGKSFLSLYWHWGAGKGVIS